MKLYQTSELDYQFGWRWLLPDVLGKQLACLGVSIEEKKWWVDVQGVNFAQFSPDHVDSLFINLNAEKQHAISNLLSSSQPKWLCSWGSGRASQQLRSKLQGFSSIREYALLPANNPRVVVPLSSPTAAIAGIRLHRPGRWIARVALLVARGLAYFGNYYLLRKKVLLIASQEEGVMPSGMSHFALNRNCDFALYLGTPDDNRKTVVLPVGAEQPRLILKVAETVKSRAALQRESEALRSMSKTLLANQVPQLLGLKADGNRLTLAQEFRRRESVSHAHVTKAVCNFLTQISMVGRRQVALADWLLEGDLLNSSGNLSGEVLEASRKLYSRLQSFAAEGKQILLHRTHGDFAPWNCSWTKQGLFVYDWEESSKQGLALSDAFYYVLSPFVHVYEKPDSKKAFQAAIEFATKLHQHDEYGSEQDCADAVQIYFAIWLMGRLNQSPLYVELAEQLERDWK